MTYRTPTPPPEEEEEDPLDGADEYFESVTRTVWMWKLLIILGVLYVLLHAFGGE